MRCSLISEYAQIFITPGFPGDGAVIPGIKGPVDVLQLAHFWKCHQLIASCWQGKGSFHLVMKHCCACNLCQLFLKPEQFEGSSCIYTHRWNVSNGFLSSLLLSLFSWDKKELCQGSKVCGRNPTLHCHRCGHVIGGSMDSAFPKLPKEPRQKLSLGVFRQNLGRFGCFNVLKHLENCNGKKCDLMWLVEQAYSTTILSYAEKAAAAVMKYHENPWNNMKYLWLASSAFSSRRAPWPQKSLPLLVSPPKRHMWNSGLGHRVDPPRCLWDWVEQCLLEHWYLRGNMVEACFEGTLWRLYIDNASDFCLAAGFAQALATIGK